MSSYTETKDSGQEKKRVVEDKISNLPDEVLIHILSFLHTKEAVSSSTLSKRWNSLWTFLPTLWATTFTACLVKDEDNFLDFVDKVLIGHKMPFLENIYVSCRDLSNTRITSWISAAAKQDVRSLKLDTDRLQLQLPVCYLPSCLFTMNKIETLHLIFPLCLSFPLATNCFPTLKELILGSLIYEDDESVQNLISGCPVLEKLYLNREGFDGLENFTVSSRSLKSLSFNVCMSEEEEDYISKITINCPALEVVHIDDNITEEFIVKDLSSVVNARLNLANYRYAFHELDTYARHVFELLTMFSNVKTLSVSDSTMKTMSAAGGEILPTFHNLKHLKFFSFDEGNWNMAAIIEFLKSTPVIEVLKFKGFTFFDEEFDNADVPNCLISHLKTIKITGYLGRKDEEKVRYFLGNSKVLENFIFKQKGAAFVERIPRGSSACKVNVSQYRRF